jgi:hypothetical protein
VVAGEVPCFVALVLRVVGVEGLQDDEEPEKAFRQVAASQWSTVVPHQPYWLPGGKVSIESSMILESSRLTAFVLSALCVPVVRATISSENARHQREQSDSSETHYD